MNRTDSATPSPPALRVGPGLGAASAARAGAVRSLAAACLAIGLGVALPSASSQRAPNDGLVVEGLRGQIPREAVARVVGPRVNDLIECVTRRRSANELLGGSVSLEFVIARAGTVRVARIASSTVGDRAAERCMIAIGATLRFPAPTGGEADADEIIQFPLDQDVRPPLEWTADRVRTAAAATLTRTASRCNVTGGTVRVTAYVGRGGRVLNSGGYASSEALDRALDCVLNAVNDLSLPDPGSYPAKVTFDVGTP